MERIEGFADPERELRRYYRTRWQAMLEVLLGWPTEAAARWASYEIDTHQRADFPLAHEHARILDTPRLGARCPARGKTPGPAGDGVDSCDPCDRTTGR